jgi:hypothetical protein
MIFLYFGLWKIFSPTKLIQANPLILMLEENELLIDKKILQETWWEVTEKRLNKTEKEVVEIDLDKNSL